MTAADPRRYPIGTFHRVTPPLDSGARAALIDQIAEAPAGIARLVSGLSHAELEKQYRPDGWTVRQVVHHIPDSHMNAYVRMKMAVTEEAPAIRLYREDRWAELPDSTTGPVALSLDLLAALHARWVTLLRALPADAFSRVYVHPEMGGVPIDQGLAIYAWHGQHHIAHIELALGTRTV